MNQGSAPLQLYSVFELTPEILITFLGVSALLLFLAIFIYHRYSRYKKEKVLFDEMQTLDFGSTESSTLSDIARRYTINEPVEILYSLRLFDEMAEKEMERVLSKPLPMELKKQYVDLLYNIRQKTYFADDIHVKTPSKPVQSTTKTTTAKAL